MRYRSAGAFRRALEDRLRAQSLKSGVPLVRLRKMVAFDRFLARLMRAQPQQWMLKGGLALQLRLGNRARTTKDIDVLLVTDHQDVHRLLSDAASLHIEDWFRFEVAPPADSQPERFGGLRLQTVCLLDSRLFERFHVDVGVGGPVLQPPEHLSMPELLRFAEIHPVAVPCYPLAQQIAEKVHAYARPHPSGEGSRVKDLADILLMATMAGIHGPLLVQATQITFDAWGTHPIPTRLPDPPSAWSAAFRKTATEVNLTYRTLAEAGQAARGFLTPVLQGRASGSWDPARWSWQP